MRTVALVSTLIVLLLGQSCASEPSSSEPVRARPAAEALAPADSATARRFRAVMEEARRQALHERPLGEIMQTIGQQFKGAPYVAGMLDEPATETLICRLDGFDCVTFVETALAMGRGIQAQDYTYEAFARHVRDQRYRGGTMDGYCSRLHYFSEWIADNEARGTVRNITRELGGVLLDKRIDFMGTHRDSYPRLAASDSLYQCILDMEGRLAEMDLYYIPQDRIRSVYPKLQAGDIIATATNIDGLDVTHTGLVFANPDGSKGFLHASTTGGVKVSPDLQSYVQNNKSQIGIVVARPTASAAGL